MKGQYTHKVCSAAGRAKSITTIEGACALCTHPSNANAEMQMLAAA